MGLTEYPFFFKAAMAAVAARALLNVVMIGTLQYTAVVRILTSSALGAWPEGVLITRSISPFFNKSTVLGRPSLNFLISLTFNPA
jgi:hypothetical protein